MDKYQAVIRAKKIAEAGHARVEAWRARVVEETAERLDRLLSDLSPEDREWVKKELAS